MSLPDETWMGPGFQGALVRTVSKKPDFGHHRAKMPVSEENGGMDRIRTIDPRRDRQRILDGTTTIAAPGRQKGTKPPGDSHGSLLTTIALPCF